MKYLIMVDTNKNNIVLMDQLDRMAPIDLLNHFKEVQGQILENKYTVTNIKPYALGIKKLDMY